MYDPDVIGYIVLSIGAAILLFALQPRWDTGGGMLMMLSLGSIAWPAIIIGLVAIYGVYLIWLLIFFGWKIISVPVFWFARKCKARMS